jgi:hypothetical protein
MKGKKRKKRKANEKKNISKNETKAKEAFDIAAWSCMALQAVRKLAERNFSIG